MLEKLLAFAMKHHGEQKYGDKPYSYHLLQVYQECKEYGILVQILAILHDIKEDTKVTDDEIIEFFKTLDEVKEEQYDFLLQCIKYISDEEGVNRKERKQKTNQKLSLIKEDFYIVLIVKLADRYCNTKNSYENNANLFHMYKKEYEDFKKSVYRQHLSESLWQKLDSLMI